MKTTWEQVKEEIENGRTFSQYPTGQSGCTAMYRWDDNYMVIPCKCIVALVCRGILKFKNINISKNIIN